MLFFRTRLELCSLYRLQNKSFLCNKKCYYCLNTVAVEYGRSKITHKGVRVGVGGWWLAPTVCGFFWISQQRNKGDTTGIPLSKEDMKRTIFTNEDFK